jgi:hypothetical protein
MNDKVDIKIKVDKYFGMEVAFLFETNILCTLFCLGQLFRTFWDPAVCFSPSGSPTLQR